MKVWIRMQKIDELRKLANTEYFDVMLLHWQHTATWPTDSMRWQDGILEAQAKTCGGGARRVGARPPGVAPVSGQQVAPGRDDPDESQRRAAWTRRTTTPTGLGNVSEVVTHVKQVRKQGMGVISMKLVGEGTFTTREDRQAAMRYRVQERRRRLRDGRLQEHRGN